MDRNFNFFILVLIGFSVAMAEIDSSYSELQTTAPSSGATLRLKNIKPKPNPAYDRESGSYIGDPDPLDPLKVKNENLKEDEEPVLNEIRSLSSVPNEPPQALEASTPESAIEVPPIESLDSEESKASAPAIKKKSVEKIEKKAVKKSPRKKKNNQLKDDEADLALERRFHNIYRTYNSRPTSQEAWEKVTGDRPSYEYVVQSGDTLWSISGTLFGDEFFWPKLWAINRQGIQNPHQIVPGLKVYFYPGNEEHSPGLELESEDQEAENQETLRLANQEDDEDLASPEDSEVKPSKTRKVRYGIRKKDSDQPTPIPDSLPLWTNKNYFAEKKQMQIELGESFQFQPNYKNNIILSTNKLNTEFTVPMDQISAGGRCDMGTIYKKLNKEAGAIQQGSYLILQPLESIETSADKEVFPYQIVGNGTVLNDQISINECSALMTTDFVFLRPEDVNLIRNQSLVGENNSEIIGGADLGDQKTFATDQLVYLSLGSYNANVGQIVRLQSQINDKINGEVKILDRYGNYAVGVLTKVNDLIEKGDTIVQE